MKTRVIAVEILGELHSLRENEGCQECRRVSRQWVHKFELLLTPIFI